MHIPYLFTQYPMHIVDEIGECVEKKQPIESASERTVFNALFSFMGSFLFRTLSFTRITHAKQMNEESCLSRETKIWPLRVHEFPLHSCISMSILKDFLFHGFQRCLWVCCEITSEIDNLTFHLMMKKELWFKINKTNRPVSAALRFLLSSFIGFRMSINKKLHVQLVRKSIELKCKIKKKISFHTVNCKEDRKRFFSSNNDMKFDIFCVAHTVA